MSFNFGGVRAARLPEDLSSGTDSELPDYISSRLRFINIDAYASPVLLRGMKWTDRERILAWLSTLFRSGFRSNPISKNAWVRQMKWANWVQILSFLSKF